MFVAASEDLDDLFDIVQRVGARADESSPSSPNDDSDLEGKGELMEVDDTEVDLIPTTVLEVEPKKKKKQRGKVGKVRMNHCFRVIS